MIEFDGEVYNYHRSVSVTYNPVNGWIYLLENEHGILTEIRLNGEQRVLDTLTFEASDEYHFMETAHTGDELLFWERGLGQVYSYDMNNSALSHISATNAEKLMYFHGGILDRNNEPLVWGGYGFWEIRKLLLRFDITKREWILESGEFPFEVNRRYEYQLWYDSSAHRADYLFTTNDKWTGESFYNTGTYDIDRSTWASERWFRVQDDEFRYNRPLFVKNTYSRDPSTGISHLSSRYFFDTERNILLSIPEDSYPDMGIAGAFYSAPDQTWILFGKDVEISTPNLTFVQLSADELPFSEVHTVSYTVFVLQKFWWIWGIAAGLILLVFLYIRSQKIRSSIPASIRIETTEEGLHISRNGSQLPVTDEFLERAWKLLYSMKNNNLQQMPVKDFDEEVFYDNHSSSFRSKKRKSVIRELNSYTDAPLIKTVTNSIDKRYKDVKVNLELIALPSS